MSDQDLSKMKVAELRDALKAKGLNTTGNKQELIDRLQAASYTEHPELDPKLEDELLKDDDLEEDEKSLLDSTHDLLKSPESSKSSTPEQVSPAKKVSLKRNTSIAMPVIEKQEEASDKPSDSTGEPEKKVIKITQLTSQERLELRAKKFAGNGNAVTAATPVVAVGSADSGSQEKLTARAARFGITPITSPTKTASSAAPTVVSEELLKKRAERFGAISTDMKKTELSEKLQKRKERFGMEGKVTLSSSTATTDEQAEKARLRLERFKTTSTA